MKIKQWNKIKEGTLLVVTWLDIKEDSAWKTDSAAQGFQPALCKNVGWFINDDKVSIRIASSVADDGDKNCCVIPKGVIKDVRKINYKNT